VLRRFLYLDTVALGDYLSALEGGLRDSSEHRRTRSGGGEVGFDARVVRGAGERRQESEETLTYADTAPARFERLMQLAEADVEQSGWIEVLDPGSDLEDVGIGALPCLECDIYVPDVVRALTSVGELETALSMLEGLTPFLDIMGVDSNDLPSRDQVNAMRAVAQHLPARLVVVGELDDSELKVAGELVGEYVRGALEGPVRLVGKVASQWDKGRWKPVLALPGSSLLPRAKRREMERTQPKAGEEANYLEGPALMLDILAIYR
jgi:hypothetical protein